MFHSCFIENYDKAVKSQPGQRRKRPCEPFRFFPADLPGSHFPPRGMLISLQQATHHWTHKNAKHSAVLIEFGAARQIALKEQLLPRM